jgi:SHS2 domain-containing protein
MTGSARQPDHGAPGRRGARWEHFHHVADVGIRGTGPRPEQAFEQAAMALVAVVSDPARIEPAEVVDIGCRAPNLELLLVDWLNAIVFEMATRKMLFGAFEVRIEGQELTGKAWGEKVAAEKHRPAAEVKGATLSELKVGAAPGGAWIAQCIVDV